MGVKLRIWEARSAATSAGLTEGVAASLGVRVIFTLGHRRMFPPILRVLSALCGEFFKNLLKDNTTNENLTISRLPL